jgi:hypothetical protein
MSLSIQLIQRLVTRLSKAGYTFFDKQRALFPKKHEPALFSNFVEHAFMNFIFLAARNSRL